MLPETRTRVRVLLSVAVVLALFTLYFWSVMASWPHGLQVSLGILATLSPVVLVAAVGVEGSRQSPGSPPRRP